MLTFIQYIIIQWLVIVYFPVIDMQSLVLKQVWREHHFINEYCLVDNCLSWQETELFYLYLARLQIVVFHHFHKFPPNWSFLCNGKFMTAVALCKVYVLSILQTTIDVQKNSCKIFKQFLISSILFQETLWNFLCLTSIIPLVEYWPLNIWWPSSQI